MDSIDQGDFLAWKHDKMTELFFKYLKTRRGWHEDNLLLDLEDDVMTLKKQIARINLIDDILGLQLEDLV